MIDFNHNEKINRLKHNILLNQDTRSVKTGCDVESVSGMDIKVNSGQIYFDNVIVDVSETTLTLDSSNESGDRVDVVVVDSNGSVSIIKGTVTAPPTQPPVIPNVNFNDYVVLAQIYIDDNTTEITNDNITDLRIFDERKMDISKVGDDMTTEIYNGQLRLKNVAFSDSDDDTDLINAGYTLISSVGEGSGSSELELKPKYFFTIGGYAGSSQGMQNVYKYDMDTDTWESKNNYPIKTYYSKATTVNNIIYCTGGFNSDNGYYNKIYQYDIDNDSWTLKTNFTTTRYKHAIFNDGSSKIIIAGGQNNNGDLNSTEIYDISTDTWSNGADIPTTSLSMMGYACYNGYGYTFGGSNNGNFSNKSYKYDIANNTWSTITDYPLSVLDSTATAYNNKIYIFGGRDSGGSNKNNVYEYDINSDSYTAKTNMPTARAYHSCALGDKKIYVNNGYNGSDLKTLEIYDIENDSWSAGSDSPITLRDTADAVYYQETTTPAVEHKLLLFGGDESGTGDLCYVYNADTNSWTQKSNLNNALRRGAIGIDKTNRKVYVTADNGITERYDIDTNTWETKTTALNEIECGGGFYYNNYFYAVGGKNYTSKIQRYSISSNSWSYMTDYTIGQYIPPHIPVYNGKAYIFWTWNGNNDYYMKVYDIANDSWSTKNIGLPNRETITYSIGIKDDKIYISSGVNRAVNDYNNNVYEYNITTDTLTTVGSCGNYYGCASAMQGDYLYEAPYSNKLFHRYNTNTNSWETLTDAPYVTHNSMLIDLNLGVNVAWWNSDWSNRIRIDISESKDIIAFTLDYKNGMKTDFSDIRFVKTNGDKLDYCITSKTDGVSANIRVKNEKLTTFYLYYNNPNATSESNPSAVFFNPVSYYTFDEDAKDLVGNNDGTVHGATLTDGRIGKAYSFDGTNDYIDIGSSGISVTNPFTISFWLYHDSTDHIHYFDSQNSNSERLGFSRWLMNCGGYQFYVDGIYCSSHSFNAGNFMFVTIISNSSGTDLYINGAFDKHSSNTISKLDNKIILGARYTADQSYLNGKIDEVGVWGKTLSIDEIQAIYNSASVTPTLGPVETNSPGTEIYAYKL